ncbi:LOW QUALITY PROTEIN: histone H4 [Dugong dugon]
MPASHLKLQEGKKRQRSRSGYENADRHPGTAFPFLLPLGSQRPSIRGRHKLGSGKESLKNEGSTVGNIKIRKKSYSIRRGKGGKELGKSGTKRHHKVLRDNTQGITKSEIRRLARFGGVKRISGLIYEDSRGVLKVFLENMIREVLTYTEHAQRQTTTSKDVVYALKRQGRTLYGFGG